MTTNTFGFRFVYDLKQDAVGHHLPPKQVLPSTGERRACPRAYAGAHHIPNPMACTCSRPVRAYVLTLAWRRTAPMFAEQQALEVAQQFGPGAQQVALAAGAVQH